MRRPLVTILALLCVPCLGAGTHADESPFQRGYQTSTLANPWLDEPTLAARTRALCDWLQTHAASLNADQRKSTREQLYYLIDAHVKQIYASSGRIWPARHDPVLEELYSWSDRLGTYGGALIYEALKSADAPDRPASLQLPSGMQVSLSDDLLQLSSAAGWSFTVPYYFMIWDVRDFVSNDGMRTQLIIVSTGAADDRSASGHSQATLMLIFSPQVDAAAFADAWKKRFNVTEDERRTEVAGRSAYVAYDTDAKLHREIVFWQEAGGSYAVAYLGLDGTYQWNRASFPDFLAALRTR